MTKDSGVQIGDRGQAASRLSPSGFVIVHSERHSARSVSEVIEAGQEVIVLNGDLHGLVVCRVDANTDAAAIPNRGRLVHSSFGASVKAEHARNTEAQRRWEEERTNWQQRVGLRLGLFCATVGIAIAWKPLTRDFSMNQVALVVVCSMFVGGVLGSWLLRVVDRSLDDIDSQLRRFALPTTILSLLGGTLAAAWAIPSYGAVTGIFVAVVVAAMTGFPLPAFMALASSSAESGPLEASVAGADVANAAAESPDIR